MEYEVHPPPECLRPVVRCVWTLQGSGDTSAETIVPDGCCELIVNTANRFRRREDNGTWVRQPRVLVAGQLQSPLTIAPTGEVDLVGIRFEPAGLGRLLSSPLDALGETPIELGEVSSPLHRALESAVLEGLRDERVPRALRVVGRFLEDNPARPTAFVERAVTLIERYCGDVRVAALADHLSVSRRTLERGFRSRVGLSPKTFARVVRFQRLLELAPTTASWAARAVDCGYYDQAHLIRDFRAFTGSSPERYFAATHQLSDLLTSSDGGTQAG